MVGRKKQGKSNGNAYEEERKMRMEENQKRLQELNLQSICQELQKTCNTATKAQQRTPKPRTLKSEEWTKNLTPRRSARVANLPATSYREAFEFDSSAFRRSFGGRRSMLPTRCASFEEREYAIEKATDIEKSLGTEYPLFIKPMLPSHVSGGFWLGLLSDFCKRYMPRKDEWFILEDEDGNETRSYYLAGKCGLSAGWRGFSIDHGLLDGDCLVFQMTKPNHFKVYIVRGDLGHDAEDEQSDFEENTKAEEALDSSAEEENVEDEAVSEPKVNAKKRKKPSNEETKSSPNEENAVKRKADSEGKMQKTNGESGDGKKLTSYLLAKKHSTIQSKPKGKAPKVGLKTQFEESDAPVIEVDA